MFTTTITIKDFNMIHKKRNSLKYNCPKNMSANHLYCLVSDRYANLASSTQIRPADSQSNLRRLS